MRRVFRVPTSRTRVEREVDDELAFHIDTRVERLVAEGWTRDDARREAVRQFGDLTTVRRDMLSLDHQRERAQRRASAWTDLRHDLAYAIRMLRRNAAFTALAVGGLALGTGANTAIYSVIHAVLVRELPVSRPNELIAVGLPDEVESEGVGTPNAASFSYPLYRDIQARNQVFTDVLATGRANRLDVYVDSAKGEATTAIEHPHGRFVTGNYFAVLGVPAAFGRVFDSTADRADAIPEATISYGYWARRFNNDSSIVGRTLLVDGIRVAITGVAARGYTGEIVGSTTDIWLPVGLHDRLLPLDPMLTDRHQQWLLLLGRAKAGVSVAQAKQQLAPLIRASIFANATPRDLTRLNAKALEYFVSSGARGLSELRSAFSTPLATLMVGVALLLAIVCVNVANLLLARGVARQREMALRLSIGANRFRIVRQLLTESLLLAVISGAVATLLGWWGSRALIALAVDGDPVAITTGPSMSVLMFTLGLAVVSVLIFGLAPALRTSKVDLASTLRSQSRSVRAGARFGVVLIATQVALSLVLLAGAAMLTRSLRSVQALDLGLDRDHLIVADLDIGRRRFGTTQLEDYARTLRERVAGLAGVSAVSYSENGLFSGTEWSTNIAVAGFEPRDFDDTRVANDHVGPGYVAAIGARLLRGRDLVASDASAATRVAIVTDAFAKFYFPSRDPIGQVIAAGDSALPVEIVGIVATARGQSIDAPPARLARRMYLPFVSETRPADLPEHLRLIVRTSGDPGALIQRVRQTVTAADPTIVLDEIRPLADMVSGSIREERLVAQVATALGVLALFLAAIGLYSVTSYTIARRGGEIGVRVALGAHARDVIRLVLAGALRPVAVGVLVGTPLAFASTRLLQRYLSNVTGVDATSVATAIVVLVAGAFIATLAPVRRALSIDAMTALRED